MNIELRFKEREGIKIIQGEGAFPVIVKILQFRHVVEYSGGLEPTKWQDVPCVGVDDE